MENKMNDSSALLEEAWDLFEEAMEETQKSKRKKLLKQVLKINPDFTDAKLELIQMEDDNKRMQKLLKLQKEEEKRLKKEGYMKYIGEFYQMLETRPYMRIRYQIFEEYFNRRQLRLALQEGEEILSYNNSDNFGVRYTMMGIYCCLEEFEKGEELMKRYPEQSVPMLLYQSVLFYRKDERIKFRTLLREIADLVPEVSLISDLEIDGQIDLEYLSVYSLEEVMYYMARFPELFLSEDMMEELFDIWVNDKKYDA